MSSESNLNLQQFQDFLFDPSVANSSSHPVKEFDFNGLWQNIHVPSTVQDSSSSSTIKQTSSNSTSLSDLLGDITSAAAAVVMANNEESPLVMDTPLLDDSCTNTPFTPALFTPSQQQLQQLSPYYSPQIAVVSSDLQLQRPEMDTQSDIQVAKYLKNDVSWHATPATDSIAESSTSASALDLFGQLPSTPSFSTATSDLFGTFGNIQDGPAAQLMLDPSSTPTVNNDPITTTDNTLSNLLQGSLTASTDFLFPPLVSDENNQQNFHGLMDDAIHSLQQQQQQQDPMLDASNLFDNCFDSLFFENNDIFNFQNEHQQQVDNIVAANNKRKLVDETTTKATAENPFKRIKLNTKTLNVSKKANKVNQNERRFQCHLCGAMFSRRYNLGTHVKTHNKNRAKSFSCHLCDKTFDRKHDLSRHISTVHNGERAFACAECSSTFSRKDALARHNVQKHNYQN